MQHVHLVDNWANEYALVGTSEEGWIDEFSKLNVKDLSHEFGGQSSNKAHQTNEWVDSYDK